MQITQNRLETLKQIPDHLTKRQISLINVATRRNKHICKAENTPIDRRSTLTALTAAVISLPLIQNPSIAAETVQTTNLGQRFVSKEGFTFDYPDGWVVGFDRSGSRGDGAVCVVGDFGRYQIASVFRTVTLPKTLTGGGELTKDTGYDLCLLPFASDPRTLRFTLIRSEVTKDDQGRSQFDFEYEIETCGGEVIEGRGGDIQCLGAAGNELKTVKRRSLGRAVVVNNSVGMTFVASSPVDRWEEGEMVLRSVAETFHAL